MGQGNSLEKIDYLELHIWVQHEGLLIPVFLVNNYDKMLGLRILTRGTAFRHAKKALEYIDYAVRQHTNERFRISQYIRKMRLCKCGDVTYDLDFHMQPFSTYIACIAVLPHMGTLKEFINAATVQSVHVNGFISNLQMGPTILDKKESSFLEKMGSAAGEFLQSKFGQDVIRGVSGKILQSTETLPRGD
jgi:hypothetical protein